ncbi:MAG TPA: hypothetical protein PLR06_08475 [Cyclobacteriaceae bacterium]|nr:hypothetical protein [Cyclobacteriaceae bacterium]
MRVINIRKSFYFPGSIIFIGVLLLGASGWLFVTKGLAGFVPLVFAVVIFTTHYRLQINLDEKEYREWLWVIGFKIEEKKKFEKIEYLYIKKSIESQRLNSRGSSMVSRREVFDGYLKFSEENKIHIDTHTNKDKLLKKLNPIATALDTRIIDYTE